MAKISYKKYTTEQFNAQTCFDELNISDYIEFLKSVGMEPIYFFENALTKGVKAEGNEKYVFFINFEDNDIYCMHIKNFDCEILTIDHGKMEEIENKKVVFSPANAIRDCGTEWDRFITKTHPEIVHEIEQIDSLNI